MNRGLTFDDVLIEPNYGNESRDDGSVETRLGTYQFKIPIISANMETITGVEMANAMDWLGGLGILHRFMSVEANIYAYRIARQCGVTVGVGDGELHRADALYEVGARLFCVDVSQAHAKLVGKMVKYLKDRYSGIYIIAGNVATYAGADYLASVGADAVKVGIGAGSVCTTREVTGVGVPQLTAIMNCARIDQPIIADGGIRTSGDAAKALAAGATMVMLGGMLSGTDEAENKYWYRGMASEEARNDYFGETVTWRTPEGVAITVSPKGSVAHVIRSVVGGIKSGLSMVGAKNLEDLRRKAQFTEVTKAAAEEGTPHGLR